MKRRSNKRWTEKEKELLEKLYKGGKTRHEIAIVLKRGVSSIDSMLHRKGLVKSKMWTEEEEKRLKKLHSEGKSTVEIAKLMDRNRTSIYVKKKQLGLISQELLLDNRYDIFSLKHILKNQVKGGFLTQEEADRFLESKYQQRQEERKRIIDGSR